MTRILVCRRNGKETSVEKPWEVRWMWGKGQCGGHDLALLIKAKNIGFIPKGMIRLIFLKVHFGCCCREWATGKREKARPVRCNHSGAYEM